MLASGIAGMQILILSRDPAVRRCPSGPFENHPGRTVRIFGALSLSVVGINLKLYSAEYYRPVLT